MQISLYFSITDRLFFFPFLTCFQELYDREISLFKNPFYLFPRTFRSLTNFLLPVFKCIFTYLHFCIVPRTFRSSTKFFLFKCHFHQFPRTFRPRSKTIFFSIYHPKCSRSRPQVIFPASNNSSRQKLGLAQLIFFSAFIHQRISLLLHIAQNSFYQIFW